MSKQRMTQGADAPRRPEGTPKDKHFTPLNEKIAQILREICHTRLLHFPPPSEGKTLGNNRADWCDFHRTTGHSIEACWTLKTQIERLIQDGRLSQPKQKEEWPTRGRSRSRQNSPVPHKGTISTISRGVHKHPLETDQRRREV
ncbi:hypothetical protein CR513_15473, partial [Mucuna pruriens]